ncbi:Protein of unknown function [Bacillus mycoides]|nr:Protein of unknown function [Bacillus mycoides]
MDISIQRILVQD